MDEKTYGLDLNEEITPLKAREAMIACFVQAHSEVMQDFKEYHKFESEEEFEKMEQVNVGTIVRTIFKDAGADFDHPTKQDLLNAMKKLADYAVNFRSL